MPARSLETQELLEGLEGSVNEGFCARLHTIES